MVFEELLRDFKQVRNSNRFKFLKDSCAGREAKELEEHGRPKARLSHTQIDDDVGLI